MGGNELTRFTEFDDLVDFVSDWSPAESHDQAIHEYVLATD